MIPIGSSGFSYTEIYKDRTGYGAAKGAKRTVTVINSKTEKIIFTLIGSLHNFRGSSWETHRNSPSKTFFGLDGRYYHIIVTDSLVQWGQVQSDGAVIKEDRTVLKHLNFYPMEVTKTTVPTLNPIIKPPAIPVISAFPAVISMPKSTAILKEEISWMKAIKNLIQKIKTWIIKILNR